VTARWPEPEPERAEQQEAPEQPLEPREPALAGPGP